MSELKATPGPWEVNRHGDVVVKGSGAIVGHPPQSGCIASLCDGEYIENYNGYDAHLVAAAPELYEAVRALIDYGNDENSKQGTWAVNKAQKALAKARGEQ